jgi:hypothetical protein
MIELAVIGRDVDIDGLIGAARTLAAEQSDLAVEVTEETHEGRMSVALWGRFLDEELSDEQWDELRDLADEGAISIESLSGPDGRMRHVALFDRAYRDLIRAAIEATGEPFFSYVGQFVTIRLSWTLDAPALVLHFDRVSRATAGIAEQAGPDGDALTVIHTSDDYIYSPRGSASLDDYIRAVELTDRLSEHGTFERIDDTGYVTDRSLIRLEAFEASVISLRTLLLEERSKAEARRRALGEPFGHHSEIAFDFDEAA